VKLCIFTLVLDGEPWIECHLPVFKNLTHQWRWVVVHGAAMNNGSTSWCDTQEPRLSTDGTSEYLCGIGDPRVRIIERAKWESKDEMINAPLFEFDSSCVLMEIDADEIWRAEQLDTIVDLFESQEHLSSIMFACDYYVGPRLVLKGEHCYGDNDYEWLRAWRFRPGMTFKSHEPPVLLGEVGRRMGKLESQDIVGRFSHYAYATEPQVAFKEKWYKYYGLLEGWKRLQSEKEFPVSLNRYFDHVKTELPLVVKI
jgi:hypothetical protein